MTNSSSDNHYAPPTAAVHDIPPPQRTGTRPREVVLAVKLAAIGYVLGLVVIPFSWDYYSRLQPPAALITNQALSLLLLIWLYTKIYAGRNWARITLLVLFLIGT